MSSEERQRQVVEQYNFNLVMIKTLNYTVLSSQDVRTITNVTGTVRKDIF